MSKYKVPYKKVGAPFGNQNGVGHGRPRTWTDQKVEREAEFLLKWAQKEDSLVLGTCYGLRGYSGRRALDWAARNESFAEAKEIAKTIIGARREVGALKGKLDASIVRTSLATYDLEYRAFLKEMKREQIIEDLTSEQAAQDISNYIKSKPQVKHVGKSSR